MPKFSFNPKKWGSKSPKITTKTTSYDIDKDSFLAYAFGKGGRVTAQKASYFYRNTSAIATAVDIIASAVKQIEPVLELPNGEFINDHPVLTMLKNPNGFSDWMRFIEDVTINYLLKHDSLVISVGNVKRPPIELWAMSLQNASIIKNIDEYPNKYLITTGALRGTYDRVTKGSKVRFYDTSLKELYHIRGYSSRVDKTQSDSPLEAAAMEARQLIQGKTHNVNLLEKGGRLSLLITFQDEDLITEDEHNERKKRINEQYAGANNAGNIGVISGDVQNIKEFGKSNKDMDFAKLETLAGYAVYLRYQIPLVLVTVEKTTFNNMDAGITMLYDNAVLPNAKVIFSGLSHNILPRYGIDPTTTRITYNPQSIEPLKQRKIEELQARKTIGIETINELRALIPGREDQAGGDVLYQPTSEIALGTEPPEKESFQTEL